MLYTFSSTWKHIPTLSNSEKDNSFSVKMTYLSKENERKRKLEKLFLWPNAMQMLQLLANQKFNRERKRISFIHKQRLSFCYLMGNLMKHHHHHSIISGCNIVSKPKRNKKNYFTTQLIQNFVMKLFIFISLLCIYELHAMKMLEKIDIANEREGERDVLQNKLVIWI